MNGIQEVSGSIPLISTISKESALLPAAEMRRVSLRRDLHNIHAQAELLKVDVEVNVQLEKLKPLIQEAYSYAQEKYLKRNI